MSTQVTTIPFGVTVVEAMSLLLKDNITAAPVMDEQGEMAGIISESDCLKAVLVESYFSQGGGLVKDYMTINVKTAHPDEDIIGVYEHFMAHSSCRIPVFSEQKLVGILSPKDLMVAALEFFERPAENQLHMSHHEAS